MVTGKGCNPTQWGVSFVTCLFDLGSERGSTRGPFSLLSPSVVVLYYVEVR